MDMNEIIQIVQNKATEIADQEIVKYNHTHPELNLTEEARNSVRTRATSQLTLQLSKFRFQKEDEEFDAHFDDWFVKNEEDDLRRACQHCLDDEANKIRNANGKSLSSLDAYLKKHLGDVHQVD
ncbi:hypothetical protein [Pseudobutyrivibrio xylanivorans]|uniref:Uncharacterized protein n=1 Tax=Pseudobutyrivibrio xylanivorans TaxID=185007 RepID=A0A5P6VVN1_PSEXY|nr:hypothetical protein [Pseudobutyrivibrio xylanivorans]QFJ55624.1 hypothetical protein FXF36_12440 [Pseudobutyrivibrio xylanivorans]